MKPTESNFTSARLGYLEVILDCPCTLLLSARTIPSRAEWYYFSTDFNPHKLIISAPIQSTFKSSFRLSPTRKTLYNVLYRYKCCGSLNVSFGAGPVDQKFWMLYPDGQFCRILRDICLDIR
jgi:hypothetical protein